MKFVLGKFPKGGWKVFNGQFFNPQFNWFENAYINDVKVLEEMAKNEPKNPNPFHDKHAVYPCIREDNEKFS